MNVPILVSDFTKQKPHSAGSEWGWVTVLIYRENELFVFRNCRWGNTRHLWRKLSSWRSQDIATCATDVCKVFSAVIANGTVTFFAGYCKLHCCHLLWTQGEMWLPWTSLFWWPVCVICHTNQRNNLSGPLLVFIAAWLYSGFAPLNPKSCCPESEKSHWDTKHLEWGWWRVHMQVSCDQWTCPQMLRFTCAG